MNSSKYDYLQPDPSLSAASFQEAEHLRQHVGVDGEVLLQPGGPGAGAHPAAGRGEEEDGAAAVPHAAQVGNRTAGSGFGEKDVDGDSLPMK